MSNELTDFTPDVTARKIGGSEGDGPGKINIGGGFFEGHYPNNLCKQFFTATPEGYCPLDYQLNDFFEKNSGMVVTGLFPVGPDSVIVFFTRILTEEEVAQFNRLHSEVRAKMDEENTKQALANAEVQKRQVEAEKEERRLAELGRKCEANHKKDKSNADD